MGKSPGKWLKTLLFRKKSFRSSSTKLKTSSEKCLTNGYEASLGDNSPIISEPVLISTYSNTALPIVEETHASDLHECETTVPVVSHSTVDQVALQIDESSGCDKESEEKAATKVQAATRGFLARRAFQALKGIVRLQALIRGHLVRRQAVATLCAMHAIVRVQANIRGRIARRSDIGLQINYARKQQHVLLGCKSGDAWKENFQDHSLGHKLLSSWVVVKPLQIQFNKEDPNSASSWLERWHMTYFWKPVINANHFAHSKPQQRKIKNSTASQSLKTSPKLTKSRAANSEPEKREDDHHSQTPKVSKTELEKPKRGLRKVSTSKSDAEIGKLSSSSKKSQSKIVQEITKNSETASKTVGARPSEVSLSLSGNGESKNVIQKRSVRSTRVEVPEKELHASTTALKPVPDVTTSEEKSLHGNRESGGKLNNRRRSSLSTTRLEIPEKELHASVSSSASKTMLDGNPSEEKPLSSSGDSGNKSNNRRRSSLSTRRLEISENELHASGNKSASKITPDVNSSEEKSMSSNGESVSRSNNRRRSSFSAGVEISEAELGSSASKSVPSYMATTESAKARLRGQNSPRVVTTPDSADKSDLMRRHSLPSGSVNGKLKSISPRTQKPVSSGGAKGVIKGERSLNLSRDGSEKSIHAEWRRW